MTKEVQTFDGNKYITQYDLNEAFRINNEKVQEMIDRAIDKAISELAVMIAHGFTEVHQRIGRLETYVEENMVTKKEFNDKFNYLSGKILAFESVMFTDHEPRIQRVEKQLGFV